MHILGASRTLPFHSIGGMQAVAWDLLCAWAAAGHHVSVLTTRIAAQPSRFLHQGVHVIQVEAAPAEKYSRAWWRQSDAVALALHQEHPIDAVLSISVAGAGLQRLRQAAPQARFLMQAHGTSWGEAQSKWRTGKILQCLKSLKNLAWMFKDAVIYRRFDEIILVGDVLTHQFAQWPMTWLAHGVARRVIRNGVDTRVFRPDAVARERERLALRIPSSARVLVFAARLHPQKGARQLLRAFEMLAQSEPNSWLLIVGSGEDERELRARAAVNSGAERICFTGAVARDRMPALLACGDVFVFPTLRQEGLPMNVLEALACGLEVVCSDIAKDVFSPEAPIRYVDVSDALNLAAVLAQAALPQTAGYLPSDYRLDRCAADYLERFRATDG